MSRQLRRILAAAGLTAALLLAAAAPSRAAGLAKPIVAVDLLGRAWSWLDSLLPAPPVARPVQRKTATGTTPIPVGPPPTPPTTGQGNMIDPEGRP
jgi:hypothetical protein